METDESGCIQGPEKGRDDGRLDFVNYICLSDTIKRHNAPYRPSGDGSAQ